MTETTAPVPLEWRKGFWSLMATQFQNAFSDLALKTLVIFLVLSRVSDAAERDTYVACAGALFAAPFILFSMFGGWLADRFSKREVMRVVKLTEIGIMLYAALALYLHNLPMELGALFLMGCHSSVFGPAKYGILPEILPVERLSWGNGLLELLTFLGIIFGTVCGGLMAERLRDAPQIAGLILACLAAIGWIASAGITRTTAAAPSCPLRLNPVTDLIAQLRIMRRDRDLWRANWGNTGFWFVATLLQMNLTIYAKDVLSLSEEQNGFLNAAMAIGIGVGSAFAGSISRGKIQYGLVPIGATALALLTVPMGFHGLGVYWFTVCLIGLGFSGGLFIVPLAAVLQHRPAAEIRGAIQGAASLTSFIGIFAVSGVQILLNKVLHFTPGMVFWFCGVVSICTGMYAVATRRDAIAQLFDRSR